MSLFIHNTQTGIKEKFKPVDPERVTLYVCGPTVYNYIHIGNARPIVVFDVLFRLLRKLYPQVVYARNITDVDDKINQAAAENNESIRALSDRYIEAFREDVAALNTLPPSIEPRATDHIEPMLNMIAALVDKQHAYVSEGHVIFDVGSMEDYGALSHRQLEDLLAGARVEVAGYKRSPADFVLWKPSSGTQPGWDSPWGRGRPGWHLECSTMIEQHLGKTIDIHGGGQDLIFPHHENERAQSQCAHGGETFVNYWMHNGYITVSGEKMSKSEGNFFTLRDVLAQAPAEAARFALLSGHYRSPLDWSPASLKQARSSLDGLYTALLDSIDLPVDETVEPEPALLEYLLDDLNTPRAIAQLHDLSRRINKAETPEEKQGLRDQLLAGGALMGVLQQDPVAWFRWQPKDEQGLSDAEINGLIEARIAARAEKDFARADEIRDQLQDAGILLEDGAGKTRWKRAG
ncbi:MAG TPA: cysteine--tRNA ligase [Gammaproteobacteria bacterium]|nr:cysteine--tRNA ligase [Gammaproteobacteria bacterium]